MRRQVLLRGFLAGLVAGLALEALMYLAQAVTGLRPLPQVLQQPLLAVMPGPVFGFLIDTLKHAGKVLEELGLVLVLLAGLGLLGAAYAAAAERRPLPYLATLFAAAGWLVVCALLLPAGGDGFLGLTEGLQAPLVWGVLFLAYSIVLQSLYGRAARSPADEADPGRRRLLTAAPLLIAGASLAVLAARLGPRWYQTAFRPPENALAGGEVPEITPVGDFYVVSKNFQDPVISASGWSLDLRGLVDSPRTLRYGDLQSLPMQTIPVTLECISNTVGGPQISTGVFTGVSLAALVRSAGPRPGAAAVNFTAADGFTESLPLSMVMAHPEILVALQLDGQALPAEHGYPARILIPGHYGMKGPKWLTSIELAAAEKGGYWEAQGWDRQAVVRTMSRIDFPRDGDTVPIGRSSMAGVAFAGARGISRVEVSTDGGRTWRDASLVPPRSPYTWSIWNHDLALPREGAYTLVVRATDGTGKLQEAAQAGSFPSGSSGYHAIGVNAAAG